MTETNNLCDLWEHTIAQVFKHDSKPKLGLMFEQWVTFNKLENFNSILNNTIDDFTPSANLRYLNEHGKILHETPMREMFSLRWYIQHLMDENEDEDENLLSHENWMKQTNWKFIKYFIYHNILQLLNNSNRNLSKKVSRMDMKKLIQRKGSQMKRKINPPHPVKSQNKILSLIHLLKMKKSQI